MPIPRSCKGFEEQYHCKVSARYMGSSDELVAKLRGGSAGNYDVISPSSDVATMHRHRRAGRAARLWRRFPVTANSLPKLHDLPLVQVNGKSLRRAVHVGTESAALRHHGLSAAARQLERDLGSRSCAGRFRSGTIFRRSTWRRKCSATTSPIPAHLYNLTDEQLDAVKKKLLELKPNIRKMWSTGGELTNLFQNHEVVAAMGWPLMTNQLRKIEFPCRAKRFPRKTPRDGSTT